MGYALPMKRERWQTKSDGEGASAADRGLTNSIKKDRKPIFLIDLQSFPLFFVLADKP